MANATATFETGKKYHQFEIRGLGRAPYVFEGVSESIYQAAPDAPKQPGSSCDYCGTPIMRVFWLRAADGKRFKVGCDCILKTDSDKALRVAVLTAKQQHERELRQSRADAKRAKDVARVNAAVARLSEVADKFRAEPHPQAQSYAFLSDKTRMDWAEWMLANAGLSGRLAVACAIEKALQ